MHPSWHELCSELGVPRGTAERTWERLAAAYATPERPYHNLSHVEQTLLALDQLGPTGETRRAAELALWFHDAVYDAGCKDNEERSAALFEAATSEWPIPADMRRHIVRAILATRHTQPQADDLAALVADSDLSILAAPTDEYGRYTAAIRAEYAQVPEDAFNAGRAAFLLKMAGNPFVYSSNRGRELWELRAQANLRRELAQLGASTVPSIPARRSPRPARRRRVILYTMSTLVIGVLLVMLVPFCAGPPSYYSMKYGRSDVPMHPAKVPGTFAPVKQTDPHTCGYCGIVAIYNAYGLDHQAAGLRFRLGTDVQLNQLVDSSTGTIPPDMTRVLEQDGFTTQTVSAANDQMGALTLVHLRAGHPALAVIKVKGLHWVVLTSENDGQLTICDSLHDELYAKPTGAYLKNEVYGVMLVKPAE